MAELKCGDAFPADVHFSYVPPRPEASEITSCGIPTDYDASKEFKNKKVVLVAVPGAFTPTCQVSHLPSFINNVDQLKAKGVDQIVVIAYNDPFVMAAWGKANKVQGDYMIFASDLEAKFSKSIGWTMGERTSRYAIVVDHGKVVYAANEPNPKEVTTSGAEAVLSKL